MDLWTNFKLFWPKLSLNCLNRTRNWLELTLVYYCISTEHQRNADGMPTEHQQNADGMTTKSTADDGVLQKGKQAF